jgi:hypothetical protein
MVNKTISNKSIRQLISIKTLQEYYNNYLMYNLKNTAHATIYWYFSYLFIYLQAYNSN